MSGDSLMKPGSSSIRAGPRTLEYGGGIECGRHDVSGFRCKGGEYVRVFPPLIWGPGDIPREKNGKLWCRRSVFKPVLGQNVRFQT